MKKYFSLLAFMLFSLVCNLYAEESNFELLSITPENNSAIDKFEAGSKITFYTNFDDKCGGFKVSIIDKYRLDNNMDGSLIYKTFVGNKATATSPWTVNFYSTITFMKGHTYIVQLEGHSASDENSPIVATVQATYTGDGSEFSYSDAKLLNIVPNEGDTFDDLDKNYIFLTFDKEVNIDSERSCFVGSDCTKSKIAYLGNPYEEQGKKIWQLNVPVSVLQHATGEFKLNLYAKDLDGQVVKGNKGLDENSYTEISYQCDLGYPEVSVYPATGKVSKISQFNFSYDQGITIINPDATFYLFNSDKSQVIYSFQAKDLAVSTDDENVLTYTLLQPLTTLGTYYLSVPASAFGLGNGTLMVDNRASVLEYSIADRMDEYDVTITPADNSQVTKLSQFVITLNKWDAAIPYYLNKEKITLTDLDGNLITEGNADIDENRTKANQCIITLNEEVETPGNYRLNIPYKAFIVDHTGNYYSEAMYFEYTVKKGPAPTINTTTTTVKAEDNSLSMVKINFTDYSYVDIENETARILIKDASGNTVSEGSLVPGENWNRINVKVTGETISQSGTYYLYIPANSINLEYAHLYKNELVVEFNFDSATSISNVEQASNRVAKVYNLNGCLVGEGNPAVILNNKKGIYIVNGKKVVLK